MFPYIFLASAWLYTLDNPLCTCLYIGSLIGAWLIYSGLLVSVIIGKEELSPEVVSYGVNIPTTILYTLFFIPAITSSGAIKWFGLFVYAVYFVASYILAVYSHNRAANFSERN